MADIPLQDLDSIDDLLDEIEANEKIQQDLRERDQEHKEYMASPKAYMASPKKRNYRKIQTENDLFLWIRKRWQITSHCEVYSMFFKKWFPAVIKRVFNDNGEKWLEVQYAAEGAARSKFVACDDVESVRPLTKALDIYRYVHSAINAPAHLTI